MSADNESIALMQQISRIQSIESRAALVGLTIYKLCEENDYGLFRQWSRGRPYVSRVFERVCGNLEARLDRIEARIFFALAPNFMAEDAIFDAAVRAGFDLASLECPPVSERVAGADVTPNTSAPASSVELTPSAAE